MLMREAGATMHFLQVTTEGSEKKKISKWQQVPCMRSGAARVKTEISLPLLSRTWQLLEESCLLSVPMSHFGMGGSSLGPACFSLSLAPAFIFTSGCLCTAVSVPRLFISVNTR